MKPGILKVLLICLSIFVAFSAFAPPSDIYLLQEVYVETNVFRKTKGLDELELREELNTIAQQHSENMARGKVSFGHSGFEKRNTMAFKSMSNIRGFAENVAFGAPTGKDAVVMWKNSAGHRQNMLGKFRFIGIGVAKDKKGLIYYTQVFGG